MSSDNVGAAKLRAYAERTANLLDEKDALMEDIRSVAGEVKSDGYSTRAFNAAVRKFRMTPEKREEADLFDMEVSTYWNAIAGSEE